MSGMTFGDFEVYEMYDSRSVNMGWESQDATLHFFGRRSFDDAAARQGFLDTIPASFMGLLFQDMDVSTLGGGFWYCVAKYNSVVTELGAPQFGESPPPPGVPPPPPPPPAPGGGDALGPEYTVSISAVTEHITQSKQTRHRILRFAGPGGPEAPHNNRAIGLKDDSEVEGVDRIAPHMEFSVTRHFGYLTLNYYRMLYSMVGKMNQATFYGFNAGEILFMGCDISSRGGPSASATFKFAVTPNELNIVIADSLEVPDKFGWDYIWVAYEPTAEGGKLIQTPYAAYVERIYDFDDYAKLKIGT